MHTVTNPVKVAGTFALLEVLEASHRDVKSIHNIKPETRRRLYYASIVLHQAPLLALFSTRQQVIWQRLHRMQLYNRQNIPTGQPLRRRRIGTSI